MPKHDYSAHAEDIERGEPSSSSSGTSLKENLSTSLPFRNASHAKAKVKDDPATPQMDIWSAIASEDPPTYRDQNIPRHGQQVEVTDPNPPKCSRGYIRISYRHYAALICTIIFLGIMVVFYTIVLFYRPVFITGLSVAIPQTACPSSEKVAQINFEPHFVLTSGDGAAANVTTVTIYETFTETTTAFSMVFSSTQITTTQTTDVPVYLQSAANFSTTTSTILSTVTQLSTVTSTPSAQSPSTVTVTSTQTASDGSSSPPTPPPPTTLTTSVTQPVPSIKPSTRFFTGPNQIGNIMGGP